MGMCCQVRFQPGLKKNKQTKKPDKMGMGNEVVDRDGGQVAPRPRCVVRL